MLNLFRRREPQAVEKDRAVPCGTRVYAIGDIHGKYDLLMRLLEVIENDNASLAKAHVVLISLGDLIDRGEQSMQVLELFCNKIRFADEQIVIRGNHEQFLLDVLSGQATRLDDWLRFGGKQTISSYGIAPHLAYSAATDLRTAFIRSIPRRHVRLLEQSVPYHVLGDYLFAHAGIRPGVPIQKQAVSDLLDIREPFLLSTVEHGHMVVHGHSISENVEMKPNRINLDTGAYKSGKLSVIRLEGVDRKVLEATVN